MLSSNNDGDDWTFKGAKHKVAIGKLRPSGNTGRFGVFQGGICNTWLRAASALAPGEGERQAGGEETSLLVPSSPDSSVTGERSVWQRPAVIWPHIHAAKKWNAHIKRSRWKKKRRGSQKRKQPDQRGEETEREKWGGRRRRKSIKINGEVQVSQIEVATHTAWLIT